MPGDIQSVEEIGAFLPIEDENHVGMISLKQWFQSFDGVGECFQAAISLHIRNVVPGSFVDQRFADLNRIHIPIAKLRNAVLLCCRQLSNISGKLTCEQINLKFRCQRPERTGVVGPFECTLRRHGVGTLAQVIAEASFFDAAKETVRVRIGNPVVGVAPHIENFERCCAVARKHMRNERAVGVTTAVERQSAIAELPE